jgi:hypothetical protein
MLRTGPWHAMPVPGMISKSCRVNSKEGTMPISAAPEANWSAHPAGVRNSRSNRPRAGPWSMPQTSGEVFRKLTADTRGRFASVWFNPQFIKRFAGDERLAGLSSYHL